MKIKKILTIIILLLITYCLFVISDSQAEFKLQVEYPSIQGTQASTDLASYIRYLYIFGLSAVGVAALGALVIGGFLYMGADTVTTKDKAREYINGAFLGLLIGLGAYLILNTINPDLLKNRPPDLPQIQTPSAQTPPSTQYQWALIPMNQYCQNVLGTGSISVDGSFCGYPSPPNTNQCCKKP